MRRWNSIPANFAHASTSFSRSTRVRKYALQAAKTNTQPVEPPAASRPDPYTLVAPELAVVRGTLLNLLGSSHPGLSEIAKYYFLHPSKQLRPLIVLLFSRATNGLGHSWSTKHWESECDGAAEELDRPLNRPDVLNDWNPSMPDHTASFADVFSMQNPKPRQARPRPPSSFSSTSARQIPHSLILPTQLRLAQIVEMIHVASLLHDDVIDESALRRGVASAPAAFGNKLSILGGDFLLGRASAALSRLGDSEVVELIATVISNLVEGEILQMRDVGTAGDLSLLGTTNGSSQDGWNIYLKKTYLKTASLMAKGARASVVLGGCKEGQIWKEAAYAYGRNVGIAFQLVDDILDYEAAEGSLGKPGGADLQLGLATGPALFACEEHPELGPMILRKFDRPGDVERARELVHRSSGVERTRILARAYADKALEIIQVLPDSDAKTALEVLTERVVKRTW